MRRGETAAPPWPSAVIWRLLALKGLCELPDTTVDCHQISWFEKKPTLIISISHSYKSLEVRNYIMRLQLFLLIIWLCDVILYSFNIVNFLIACIHKKVGHFCPQIGLMKKVSFLDSRSGHVKFMWGSCEAHVMVMWAGCPMELQTHYSRTSMVCFSLSKASSKPTIRGCTNWRRISNSQVARSWLSGVEKGINLAANCLSVDFSVHCLTTANMPLWDGERKGGRVEEGKKGRERVRGKEGFRKRKRRRGKEGRRGGRWRG